MNDVTISFGGKVIGVSESIRYHGITSSWERQPAVDHAVPMKAGATVSLDNAKVDWFGMAPLFGIQIVANRVMFETRVPARQHKNKRIHKKWQKRYGVKWRVSAVNDRDAIQVAGTVYMHPTLYERLQKACEIK